MLIPVPGLVTLLLPSPGLAFSRGGILAGSTTTTLLQATSLSFSVRFLTCLHCQSACGCSDFTQKHCCLLIARTALPALQGLTAVRSILAIAFCFNA